MKNIALIEARKNLNLTQKKLAEIVGVSQSAIAHIENGKREPSKKLMESISEVLNESVENIFFNKEYYHTTYNGTKKSA